jgi:hypothetical protein
LLHACKFSGTAGGVAAWHSAVTKEARAAKASGVFMIGGLMAGSWYRNVLQLARGAIPPAGGSVFL